MRRWVTFLLLRANFLAACSLAIVHKQRSKVIRMELLQRSVSLARAWRFWKLFVDLIHTILQTPRTCRHRLLAIAPLIVSRSLRAVFQFHLFAAANTDNFGTRVPRFVTTSRWPFPLMRLWCFLVSLFLSDSFQDSVLLLQELLQVDCLGESSFILRQQRRVICIVVHLVVLSAVPLLLKHDLLRCLFDLFFVVWTL